MKNNYRLTVHVENQPKVDTSQSTSFNKPEPQKSVYNRALEQSAKDRKSFLAKKQNNHIEGNKGHYKVYTTLSFYCSSKQECMIKLSSVRSNYTIAKGNDHKNKKKFNKELYNISFVN